MISIIRNKDKNNTIKLKPWAILFWIAIWQCGSLALDSQILLVSPLQVLVQLCKLSITSDFWTSIFYSLARIFSGFLLGASLGILFAGLSARFRVLYDLMAPFILTIKTIPVASFIILALVWFSTKYLSIFISFLIVFPIIYATVLQSLQQTNQGLLEMVSVFKMNHRQIIRYLYFPHLYPALYASCSVGIGLSWKSGIAAEVIGMPTGSIGEHLQQAKTFLDTPSLFAWTIVILIISLITERLFLKILHQIYLYSQRT